jgi:predicted secreted Zn-dependent protease
VFDIEIDKRTRSIENAISGDSFKTNVLQVTNTDIKNLKKENWVFDWKQEFSFGDRVIYKLIIEHNPKIIQGLISLQD